MSDVKDRAGKDDCERSTLILAAWGYASVGLKVFPLCDQSKVPRIKGWREQATCDRDQIAEWFEKWPDSNIGIMMGGGIIALDIDMRNGGPESFRSLEQRLSRTPTAEAITGSGGRHYLFCVRGRERIKNIQNLMPGVDIKSDGGYIVAYPSVHPDTGRDYIWLSDPTRGIADAPEWLMRMIRDRNRPLFAGPTVEPSQDYRKGSKAELLSEVIRRFPVTAYGQRNDRMVAAVGRLYGKRYDPNLIADVMQEWWENFDALGVIRTPLAQSSKEIWNCIRSTMANKNFRQAVGKDHRSAWAKIEIGNDVSEFIRHASVEQGQGHPYTLLLINSIRVKKGTTPKLCRTAREIAFVEAMVIYFTYKVYCLGESPLRITRKDLCSLMQDRYGLAFDNRQHEDHKAKYVSRPNKPATRFDLARQVKEGHQGSASVYELTGLKQFIPRWPYKPS